MGEQPEQLKSEIERTREDLGQDMDRLAEKISPTHAAERTIGRMTEGIATKASQVKDSVMGTAGDASSSVADLASDAPDMVRRRAQGNPLAVGLIAFGAGWLVGSLLPASAAERRAVETVKDKAQSGDAGLTGALSEATHSVVGGVRADLTEPAKHAAEDLKQSASEAVESVRSG